MELSHERGHIIAKQTSGNSYLHYPSCYHLSCCINIPGGQFQRLRRNCTKKEDYDKLGQTLVNKFSEKGFPSPLLHEAFQKHAVPLPPSSNGDREAEVEKYAIFDTGYNDKHKKITQAIRKHWNISQLDPKLTYI